MVSCICDCGETKVTRLAGLRNGDTVSCGCRQRSANLTHGKSRSLTYTKFRDMLRRTSQRAQRSDWFERGIRVCESWRTFENFLADMGECPPGLTLERIDNDKGYEPGNCCWATTSDQARNRRSNRWIEVFGERLCITDAAAKYGISVATAYSRLRSGWSLEKTFSTPAKPVERLLEYKGDVLSVTQMARKHGLKREQLQARLGMGWTLAEAIERPVQVKSKRV